MGPNATARAATARRLGRAGGGQVGLRRLRRTRGPTTLRPAWTCLLTLTRGRTPRTPPTLSRESGPVRPWHGRRTGAITGARGDRVTRPLRPSVALSPTAPRCQQLTS